MVGFEKSRLNSIAKLGPASILLPVLVYAIASFLQSNEAELIYRSIQVTSLIALLVSSYYLGNELKGRHIDSSAKTILIVLLLNHLAFVADFLLFGSKPLSINATLKILLFLSFLLIVSRYLELGFRRFISFSYSIAIVVVVLSLLQMLLSPIQVFGRHLWFGLHPNLGGEVLFFCCCVFLSKGFSLKNLMLSALAIVAMGLLESRAAIVGSLFVCFLLYVNHVRGIASGRRFLTYLCLGALVFYMFLALFVNNALLPAFLTDYLLLNIFRINDEYRGLGTGLVGRDVAFADTVELLRENYLTGAGIGNALVEERSIHNGFLKIIAELGLLVIPIIALLVRSLLYTYRFDFYRFSVLVGCMFVFYFSDRGFNTNIFPMVFWLAILSWSLNRSVR